LRELARMEAPAKPASPACAWCDAAEWRWNGYDWYPADAVTHKQHVCMTSEAVADRAACEARAAAGPLRRAFATLRH
jgi:hypothetical protein